MDKGVGEGRRSERAGVALMGVNTTGSVCCDSIPRNVANYCYVGHASAECTAAKIAAGENMASEALKQSSAGSQPIYKQGIVNMRGAVYRQQVYYVWRL